MARRPKTAGDAPKKRRSKKAASIVAPLPAVSEPLIDGADEQVINIPQPETIDDERTIRVDETTGALQIDHDDGSITIDAGGIASIDVQGEDVDEHDVNLAHHINTYELSRIANDLLDGIQADKQDRTQWEQMRAKSIELLGMKLEDPKGEATRSTAGVSTSSVRDPVLLEAVERFRANAYAELCPSAGPVKVVSYADDGSIGADADAQALQEDMNYYLTTTASEYYPDTRFMLWWTGLTSGTFKKVYRCPLRQRPVSEYVDGTDLIVPASATDLKNAARVTHEVRMQRSTLRAMQLAGVYRDIPLGDPMQQTLGAVAQKIASVDGRAPMSQRIEDQEFTVFECYCKLDIAGFEHEVDGEPTGLPLPYRVTIDEASREVLEIRRNWDPDEDNDLFRQPMIPFVLFPYSTGISRIYGAGLGQMMGNMASALTALLRISIDNGMFANYPGLLKAKGADRQLSNNIMVPPGGAAEVDTNGLPIQQAVMPMPFKDVSQAVVALIEQTRGVAQRLGGTADLPVGEGRQDAPVGTTLAMIEQATKIEGSVHKALHAAQSEEFRLLARLFREDPEALFRGNKRPKMGRGNDEAAKQARVDRFLRALERFDIEPQADPNVPSDMHRSLMALGFKQFTVGNPAYNPIAVDKYVAKQVFKMGDGDFMSMLAPAPQGPPQLDPVTQKQIELEERKVGVQEAKVGIDQQKVQLTAANAEADRQLKGNIEALKIATQATAEKPQAVPDGPDPVDPIKLQEVALKRDQNRLRAAEIAYKNANAQADRESKETIEALKLANSLAVHPGSDPIVDEQLGQMSAFLKPAAGASGRSSGGSASSQSSRPGAASGGPVFLSHRRGTAPAAPSLRSADDETLGREIVAALALAQQITSGRYGAGAQ